MPASNGTPTIATSQLSTSLNSGSLANVDGPANLGTYVPLIGWIGFLLRSFFIYKQNVPHSF